jgi:hypothetical protein
MAKTRLNDFSQTAADNADVAGVGILGSNKPSNLDDAFRALMAIIANWREGTSLNATANFNDPTDISKTFEFSGANIPTATNREIDVEAVHDALERGAVPSVITTYTAPGAHTHTFADATIKFQIFAVGGGGGGGGVDGQGVGTGASTAGANSGFFGRTNILAKGVLETGAIVIGAAGVAGDAFGGDGGDGGDTTWIDATNGTLTWKGGKGSTGIEGSGSFRYVLPLANAASSASLTGSYNVGNAGNSNGTTNAGGVGASTPWGTGGVPSALANNTAVNGVAGVGYGAGASGSASNGITLNSTGAAGTGGRLEVWEW